MRSLHKNKYILIAMASLLGYGVPVYSADSQSIAGSVHAQITREALTGTLAEASLAAIVAANDSQDLPNGDGATEKRRHFDGGSMSASVGFINREKTRALNLASEADTDLDSRSDALRHFGMMVHCVQDFYLHSNYVELQLEQQQNKSEPYNIALVDWSKIPDGYTGTASGSHLTAARQGATDDLLNKDSDGSVGGKQIVSGDVTYFKVARELALRETQRQWNLFETLLRARCGERAPSVVAALRQAGPVSPGKTSSSGSEAKDY